MLSVFGNGISFAPLSANILLLWKSSLLTFGRPSYWKTIPKTFVKILLAFATNYWTANTSVKILVAFTTIPQIFVKIPIPFAILPKTFVKYFLAFATTQETFVKFALPPFRLLPRNHKVKMQFLPKCSVYIVLQALMS